ncbi:MAG: hypothetical protein CVU33_11850 [Betaproteobacteria bacterium HGW-Betaproteobacteria-6]|jgi:predicted small lipoprotein YifL|nr:MAG: hypothetical protein CVU33_11850 [Betaproteobacteria bacterium HGW-Betaproteobacteria-6]
MNKSLLVAALLAVALTACGKKDESVAALPPAVAAPSLPAPATPPVLPNIYKEETAKPTDSAAPNVPASESAPAR